MQVRKDQPSRGNKKNWDLSSRKLMLGLFIATNLVHVSITRAIVQSDRRIVLIKKENENEKSSCI